MNKSGYDIFEFIIGILFILLGVITLFNPGSVLSGLVMIFGIAAIIMGISDIIFYTNTSRLFGFGPVVSLISGIISIMSGVMLIIYPNSGTWILSLLVPLWFIAHCISRLSRLNEIRLYSKKMYYFTLVVNVIGLILGFILVLKPRVVMISVGVIVSIYLILLGIECIAIALGNRRNYW